MKDVGTELNPTNAADHIRIEELYALTATELDDGNRDFVRAMTHDYLVVESPSYSPWAARASTATTFPS